MKKKYTYKYINNKTRVGFDSVLVEMNALGAQGWRFVATVDRNVLMEHESEVYDPDEEKVALREC